MADYKQNKILEEERKEGRAPAEVDAATGLEINPHIPSYIVNAPWYLDQGEGSTLEHQRPQSELRENASLDTWYKRGQKRGPAATSYRKGACDNCGAISHKTKDCMERPRKKGARFTGVDIMADEVVEEVSLNFEEKRDRWNGYNPDEQLDSIREWEVVEAQRKIKREAESKERKAAGEDDGEASDASESDDEKYAEGVAEPVQKKDMKAKDRVTVKNLRIREDTAKYLLNLDVDSSHYDPKTRSMRENPNMGEDLKNLTYTGDNFYRSTGDTSELARQQVFAWDAAKHNADVHMQANPSQAELLYKRHMSKKTTLNTVQKESILSKYGGEEHLSAPPKELLMGAQTEEYTEYSQSGQVIVGREKIAVRSIYEEDKFPMNHTAIWGSFWKDGEWGYKCCHSAIRNSYCAGEAGKAALKASEDLLKNPRVVERKVVEEKIDKGKSKAEEVNMEQLKGGVTEKEMEEYHRNKSSYDDPMKNYL